MNEHLQERFRPSKQAAARPATAHVWLMPQQLNLKVRRYFEDARAPVAGGRWLDRPEIPTSAEVLDTEVDISSSSDVVEIVPNREKGAWESKEAYLEAHYELLREDAIRPLREAVSHVRATPLVNEDGFNGAIGIYEKVHVCGIVCSTRGIATRITFSLIRTGKKILWEQSKRLTTGSLVVLTPANDMFKTKAIVATVAARPLSALQQNPPEIDLFISRAEEQELDPAQEFVMIEHKGSLFEASRHTLLALQKMMREPFPLSEHLVGAKTEVSPPNYVQEHSKVDMTSVLNENKHETYENVDLLRGWPKQPRSDLDHSQLDALRSILARRLAIVQGPPGTGKTFISVQAVKVMLDNRQPGDPPIIIACQTNHAIDQFLRHIAQFENDFVRLGGRSKDTGIIKARTLYEVRKATSENPLSGCLAPSTRREMRKMEKQFDLMLTPLKPTKQPLDFHLLLQFRLLTKAQADSLDAGASQWVQDQLSNPSEIRSPFTVWLGANLVAVPPKQLPEESCFDYEEADLEFEQLQELEAEHVAKDNDDFETLSGTTISIADNFTGRKIIGKTQKDVRHALKEQDLWKIPEALRPAIYRHLQSELKKILLATFREETKKFNDLAARRRVGLLETDEVILKKQKIIGMTTTGFSKYRGLISSLEPKIILVEEAAETLEAPITVTCLPSLQHLILVGDHKQLRPNCNVKDHENSPYYLNVSLFERMVNNRVAYSTLVEQRRMIPEVRRVLRPIYGNIIKDHPSVHDPNKRWNVPGMAGVNSYFFTHEWPEQRDEYMSACNPEEADMIVGFFEYLVYNGVTAEDITILTFYNGQRKRILRELRKRVTLSGLRFTVVTVDSYQGEENKIVILSLVRSNHKGQIGFLSVDNRVCVALSRAQCGFYMFGNGSLLYGADKTWEEIINIMAGKGPKTDRLKIDPVSRLGESFPVRCSNHNNQTQIYRPSDWENITGGCAVEQCPDLLPCGHPCQLKCHPFPHDVVNCTQQCGKPLPCGHVCSSMCGEKCACQVCTRVAARPKIEETVNAVLIDDKAPPQTSTPEKWMSYAKSEPLRYAAATSAPLSPTPRSRAKKNSSDALVDIADVKAVSEAVALFSLGNCNDYTHTTDMSSMELLSMDGVGFGEGITWTEKFVLVNKPPQERKDWSKEVSLLD